MANSRIWIPGLQERLIEDDGVKKTFFSVSSDGSWQYRYEFYSVAAEVEASKQLQNDPDHWKNGVEQEQVHYAHIPDAILFKWHCEGVDIKDNSALFSMVNNPDWSYLKCVDKSHVAKG
jgi:hypothetical protein